MYKSERTELGVGSAGTIGPATNYGIVSVARQKIRATNHQATRVKKASTGQGVKYTSELTGPSIWPICRPLTRGRIPMEYKGVEYSVVQLTDGMGWRWEIRLDDGKNKSGSTPVSRAVAIKQAEHEIDRILKSGK
jgi:hypothetical protein